MSVYDKFLCENSTISKNRYRIVENGNFDESQFDSAIEKLEAAVEEGRGRADALRGSFEVDLKDIDEVLDRVEEFINSQKSSVDNSTALKNFIKQLEKLWVLPKIKFKHRSDQIEYGGKAGYDEAESYYSEAITALKSMAGIGSSNGEHSIVQQFELINKKYSDEVKKLNNLIDSYFYNSYVYSTEKLFEKIGKELKNGVKLEDTKLYDEILKQVSDKSNVPQGEAEKFIKVAISFMFDSSFRRKYPFFTVLHLSDMILDKNHWTTAIKEVSDYKLDKKDETKQFLQKVASIGIISRGLVREFTKLMDMMDIK